MKRWGWGGEISNPNRSTTPESSNRSSYIWMSLTGFVVVVALFFRINKAIEQHLDRFVL